MNTQPEALRLADGLENTPNWQKEEWGSNWKSSAMQYSREPFQAATELRRLHEVNQMLVWAAEMALIGLESMRILLQKGRTAHAENEIAIVFEILSHALAKAKEQS